MKRRILAAMLTALSIALGALSPAYAESVSVPTDKDLTRDLRIGEIGTTYYISSSGGSDDHDGMSEDAAFASFAPLADVILGPGDCVLLRRGDVWHERLLIRGSGRADAWIFIGTYGDKGAPAPEISLNNDRDDICVLVSDILTTDRKTNGFDYIWIDGLKCSHTCLGIYFRAAYSEDNEGIRVTNCIFEDVNCPDLMREALTDLGWIGKPKGNLPTVSGGRVQPTGGGVYEYVWPTAVNIGGRPTTALAGVTVPGKCAPMTAVSGIEMYQCTFTDTVICVGANAYYIHYGAGPDQCYTYTTNWRVRGLIGERVMTLLNVDSADFGWDGTPESEWGIFDNLLALSGMADFSMSAGTTQALFSNGRNLCIRNSQFNGCRNNGQPDGCGFDFERGDRNFLLENCVFAENEGQSVLMMQTTMENQVTHTEVTTENEDCTLKNCLFYNNFRNVWNSNYKYDFQMFNAQNRGILITGCAFWEPKKTSGNAVERIDEGDRRMRAVGPERDGVTYENNEEHITDDPLLPLAELMETRGLTDAAKAYRPAVKLRDDYTGPIIPETEAPTQPVTEPVTDPETRPETEPDPQTEPVTTAETSTEKTGCASAVGIGAAVLTAGAALTCRKKKEDPV